MSVLDSMTLQGGPISMDTDDGETQERLSRTIIYDPQATVRSRGDPMNYGAYRRWKLAEEEVKKKKAGKNKDKDKKNDFFESIKNLGSGPVGKVFQ